MTQARTSFGQEAESLAATYLQERNFEILERNVRLPFGELDLVCRKEKTTIVVEVKAGSFDPDLPPYLHLDGRKKRKIKMLTQAYLARQGLTGNARIDLITVTRKQGRFVIDHFENVVQDS